MGLAIFYFISSFFIWSFSWAAEDPVSQTIPIPGTKLERKSAKKSGTRERRFHFLLAYGSEYRPERDVEKNYKQHYFSNYSLGIGYDRLTALIEKAEFKESSGNATLNLERKYQNYLLWGQYSVYSSGLLNAFGGVGVGAYQEIVTTHFLGSSAVNSASYKFLSAGALGIRLNASVFFSSLEARMLFGDQLDQQPSFGGVLRAGLWF